MKEKLCLLGTLLVCGAAISPAAHAYLDPGTGSLILQGLIAGIAAAAVTLRLYWDKVKAFFSSNKHEKQLREETTTDDDGGPTK